MEHPEDTAPEGGDFARGEETEPRRSSRGSFADHDEEDT